jgi:hypothetical protein
MVQGGDIAPTDSDRKSFQVSCDAYAKHIAAESKLANENLPALNKLLAAEKLAPLSYSPGAAPASACTR